MSDTKIEFRDNSDETLKRFAKAKLRGLEAIGLQAEGYAKKKITRERAVDTGRLRNSITYAVAGREANVKSYKADKKDDNTYTYNGTAEGKKDSAVYVGTNVEYAEGIETGTHRRKGAVHFLQDAAANHGEKYKAIMEESMKNA